ncbi:ATP-binding protein [Anaeroselena agilis]|uniref:histidine kinase n=1 Tax=Anaeroselena agilis TaxID=3063788 RepID=A0ABU3NSJ7_9FIRM|nr:ATP-binding protein [Selenomonadales bacterium 4137-cl]
MGYGLQDLRDAVRTLRSIVAGVGEEGIKALEDEELQAYKDLLLLLSREGCCRAGAGEPQASRKRSIIGQISSLARLGPWEYRPDSDLFEFNDDFYAIYGTTMAREGRYMASGEYVREFVHPDDARLVLEIFAESSKGRRPGTCEHRIIRRDGAVRTIRVWAVEQWDLGCETARTFGVNQDVTEYKIMEEELRASREQLSVAAKLAHLGPWVYDQQKGLFEFRDEFYAVYGTTMAREGRFMAPEIYVREFVHPEDAEMVRAVIADSTSQGPSIIEHRVVRRDGEVRAIRVWRGVMNRDADGNLEKIFGGNQDITERIIAENHLRESEERQKATLNALPDMLLRMDAAGRLFDYRVPEHFAGYLIAADKYKTVDDMLPAHLAQLVRELVLSSLLLGKTKMANYSGQSEDTVCSLEIRTATINKVQALVIIRDQTELYRAQREVQRLDSLNLIGEMAASIGHEVRNPLTTVRGYLQFLSGKEQFENQRGMFQVMIDELDRTNAIISEFLALAKNKAVKLERININTIISAIYPLLEVDAAAGDKTMRLELTPDLPDTRVDVSEFRQLLINLVRNGLEAMEDKGCLTIATARDGKDVVLSVRDEGAGIPVSMIAKIGTPFTTTKENGTGLGLSVCYSIAARHGAAIDFTTGVGGTEFVVRFKGV